MLSATPSWRSGGAACRIDRDPHALINQLADLDRLLVVQMVSPRIAFNHDVEGTTPGPGGNFLEGRKSGTLGVEANYLNKLVFDLSWTAFFGGGHFNQISDRDFASFTVKYSF